MYYTKVDAVQICGKFLDTQYNCILFATDYPGPRDGDLALEYEEIGMSLMIIFRKTKCFAANNGLIHFYRRDYDVVEIYFDIGKIRL